MTTGTRRTEQGFSHHPTAPEITPSSRHPRWDAQAIKTTQQVMAPQVGAASLPVIEKASLTGIAGSYLPLQSHPNRKLERHTLAKRHG